MALKNKSEVNIIKPEFVNLQPTDISPLISSCDIKVCYVGQNRNHSFMTKEVLTKMSKTLRGNPIVGYFRPEKQDFDDHGSKITIDRDGFHEECMTRPYGFVAPDAKVWFQLFEDTDEFGNTVMRDYLCTTGYLWTGQYEECESAITEGKPQSMEFDDKKFPIDGHWSTDSKSQKEFFIINDATFSKLCILGDDVEPCFEGASVTEKHDEWSEVNTQFSLDDDFKAQFSKLMQEFNKFALQIQGGQTTMPENNVVTEEQTVDTSAEVATEFSAEQTDVQPEVPAPEFKKEDDKEKEEDKKSEEAPEKEDKPADEEGSESTDKEDEDKKEQKRKYELLETQYNELNTKFEEVTAKYEALVAECESLKSFKAAEVEKQKDALIASFNMLDDTDADKVEIVSNKANYSLEELEAKLSVLCFRKKVNFNLDALSENEVSTEDNKPITTFSLESADEYCGAPAWLKAVDSNKNR